MDTISPFIQDLKDGSLVRAKPSKAKRKIQKTNSALPSFGNKEVSDMRGDENAKDKSVENSLNIES